jgi:hypothetical protein
MQAPQGAMLGSRMIILDVDKRQASRAKPLGLVSFHKKAAVISMNLRFNENNLRDGSWFKQHAGCPPCVIYLIVICFIAELTLSG